MSFEDLMDRFKKRKRVRVVHNGTVLATIDTDGPVLLGQEVYLQCDPTPIGKLTGVKPIHVEYKVTKIAHEQDVVVAHVTLVREAA